MYSKSDNIEIIIFVKPDELFNKVLNYFFLDIKQP